MTADATMPTPAITAKIHRAMAVAQGVREAAAAELGLSREELDAAIQESPELVALWGVMRQSPAGPDRTIEESYTRDKVPMKLDVELAEPVDLGLPEGVSPRDHALAKAFTDQNVKLQKFDWEGVGVKEGKTLALMKQFEGSGVGRGVLRMMDAMQGGMAFCFAQVSRQFADVAEQLEAEMEKPVEGVGAAKRDENRVMFLHARFMDLAKEMQKFNKEATAAAHTRLLIADRAQKIQQSSNRMKKPTLRLVRQDGAPKEAAHG